MAPDAASGAPATGRPSDRWAHRRGEPRVFALLWTIYLLCASLLTVLQGASGAGLDAAAARRPAQSLLVLIGAGMGVLWPMVRLSQVGPRRPVQASLLDIIVILLPMQAVLWPATLLGRWTPSITLGVSAAAASWALLLGSILANACGRVPGAGRTVWMLLVLLLALGAPAARFALHASRGSLPPDGPAPVLLLSPLTAGPAATAAISGGAPRMTLTEWVVLAAPAALSCPLWLVAAARTRRAGRR